MEEQTDTIDMEQMLEVSELRLSLLILQNELNALKQENQNLKMNIQQLCMNESMNTRRKKTMTQDTIDRWKYYHEHKDAIRQSMGTSNWRDIKRESDRLYSASQIS